MVQNYLAAAMAYHKLPAEFAQTLSSWYLPLASQIAAQLPGRSQPLVLGVQGSQGSGKSTLADFLQLILLQEYQASSLVLSLDDFYLTRAERAELAQRIHPLLITRGVPGTHDIPLALTIIEQLMQLGMGESLAIPRFNKALDDRAPKADWDLVEGPLQVIIFEGWCTGLAPQPETSLVKPVNRLEAEEDSTGTWRRYVNRQLAGEYQTLFQLMDFLVVLSAPSFDAVYQWRLLQEQKLAQRWAEQHPGEPARIQSPEQLQRFIAHYQRLTQWGLESLPAQADVRLLLDQAHQVVAMIPPPPERVQRSR